MIYTGSRVPRQLIGWVVAAMFLQLTIGWIACAQVESPESSGAHKIDRQFGKLPMHFEVNRGQTDNQVEFLARGSGYTIFLTPTEAVLSLRKFDVKPDRARLKRRAQQVKSKYEHLTTSVLRMRLVGANPQARITGVNELSGRVNYFIGSDPNKWLSNVPIFARVRYEDVYHGVDLVYYGDQGQVEYDFLVEPGANPDIIALEFEGANQIELDANGELIAQLNGGPVRWRKPIVYQDIDGQRRKIEATYRLKNGHTFGFQVGDYDSSKPLIIDPALSYSTYLGGTSDDAAHAIAVDSNGYAYIAGDTSSSDFPKKNPINSNSNLGGFTDAFVTKLGPTGTNLIFSTYLGGNGFDSAHAIAVDKATNVYVVGYTDSSTTFPTKNPYQNSRPGDDGVFLSKLDPSGSSLLYSTYFGGSVDQAAYSVTADTNGNAFVTGDTMSSDFPVRNAFQSKYGGTFTNLFVPLDAFVAKFDTKVTTGNGDASLVYSTYLGGNDDDSGQAITVDTSGNAYITGYSYSTNYPLTASTVQTDLTYFVDEIGRAHV